VRSARVIVVSLGSAVVCYIPALLPSSVQPRIDADFPFRGGELGLVVAVFFGVSAVASRPAGGLADRIGAARAIRAACVIQVLSLLAVAFLARSYLALVALVGVSGLGNALSGPSSASLIAARLPSRLRPFGFGLTQSGGAVAALLTGLAVPAVAVPLGWRWLFALAAALGLAIALAAPGGPAPRGPRPRTDLGPQGSDRPTYSELGPAGLLGVAAALAAMATVGMSSFIVPYAVHAGVDESWAGLILAAVGLTGALGRPLFGVLLGRGDVASSLLGAALLLGSASVGFGILTVPVFPALLVGAVLVGGIGGSWTSLGTLASTALAPRQPGAAVGVLMTGLFTGAVVGPALIGTVSARTGFTPIWLAAAIAALLAAFALLHLRREMRKARTSARRR
jgi:MFS family permease